MDADTGYGHVEPLGESVIPAWITNLSFQKQSVLLLALRGPDGVRKYHPMKEVTRAYRATMLRAAMRGRFLDVDEAPDSFMALKIFSDAASWAACVKVFFDHVDELPHHYVAHIAHAAQILAEHHPLELFRNHWGLFYKRWCDDLHLNPESPEQMAERLGDWGQAAKRLGTL